MRKFFRVGACVLLAAATLLLATVGVLQSRLPGELFLLEGQDAVLVGGQVEVRKTESDMICDARLWGVIPLGSVTLHEVERPYLVPCGQPFGLKMLTGGVVVIAYDPDESGRSPAEAAGVRLGDVITSVDGVETRSANDVARALRGADGDTVPVELLRGDQELLLAVAPVEEDGADRLGLWVRDSSAGIGTMTYYDPLSGVFAGLGHGVCDADTGRVLPFGSGEAVQVSITGATRGRSGVPGELTGEFRSAVVLGELTGNGANGVFGRLYAPPSGADAIPIAFQYEIETGKAQILVTLDGTTPAAYEIEIVRVNTGAEDFRDLVVRVTDPVLLEATGGIVQGMSGSPILQNGRIVGAVTHVFVNDPTRGYGIFIENMLNWNA